MAELAFDTTVNYQKIFMEGSVPLSVSNPNSKTTATITHNLGYIPNVRVWYENASGKICPAAGSGIDALISGTTTDFSLHQARYQITATTVTLIFDRGVTVAATVSTTMYYRIYYDAA